MVVIVSSVSLPSATSLSSHPSYQGDMSVLLGIGTNLQISSSHDQGLFTLQKRSQCQLMELQEELAQLAQFLGEKPDSDPAALFKLLHSFAQLFDATVVQVMKKTNLFAGSAV